jgi:hypothetical protein
MALLWVTFLIGFGVMFGLLSLAIDVGYGMGQVRGMQNGSDAGSMAAARLLAGSVVPGAGGGVVFLATNGDVHNAARVLAEYNRPAGLQGAIYPLAVQFRPCPGQTGGSPDFTSLSDGALVAEVGGTKFASDTTRAPTWTCMVTVYARVIHHSMFSSTMGKSTMGETAKATARILPTANPNTGPLWPITRWICTGIDDPDTTNKDEGKSINDVNGDTVNGNQDKCDDDDVANIEGGIPCAQDLDPDAPILPCTFWDSNSDPQGDTKQYVDLSRFSGLAREEDITREQMFTDWEASCAELGPDYCPVEYDPATPPGSVSGGNNDKVKDVPYWIEHGWHGKLDMDPDACPGWPPPANVVIANPATILNPANCPNSRVELHSGAGNLGNNIADAMRNYINRHWAGNSEGLCGFSGTNNPQNDFANVTVFFWRWGEQDTTNHSIARNNESRLWGYYGDNIPDSSNDVKRLIVQQFTNFRFCRGLVEGSRVRGFFVSYITDLVPGDGSPSPIANTVGLVE